MAITLALIIGFLVAGFLLLYAQFQEPHAIEKQSLISELGATSVLAVLAHPDDEILISSLLGDAAARPDVRVRTITVTHGETGRRPKPDQDPEQLAEIRAAELVNFGRFLGLDGQEIWGYPDAGLSGDLMADLERDIVVAIRRWKPDLVVTFEPNTGFTLHPDHMVVGRIADGATQTAADLNVMPEVSPPHAPRWIAFVLAPRRMLVRFGGPTGQKIAAKQPLADYSIPAKRSFKTVGWEIHASQRNVIEELFGVPPWLLYFFWDKEHYAIQERGSN